VHVQGTNLWHVLLFSFYDSVPESVRQAIYERYQTLGEDCGGKDAGILFLKVEWNLDIRKKVHLVEIALFQDDAALQAFRVHPKHKELTDMSCQVADWQVGDLHLPYTAVPL